MILFFSFVFTLIGFMLVKKTKTIVKVMIDIHSLVYGTHYKPSPRLEIVLTKLGGIVFLFTGVAGLIKELIDLFRNYNW